MTVYKIEINRTWDRDESYKNGRRNIHWRMTVCKLNTKHNTKEKFKNYSLQHMQNVNKILFY